MEKIIVGITGDFAIDQLTSLQSPHIQIIHIKEPKSEEQIADLLKQTHFFIAGGPEYFYRHILVQAKKLKAMVVMGTGINGFLDLRDAQKLGIEVYNTPAINYKAVGEMAVAAMVMMLCNAFHSVQTLKEGSLWYQTPRISLSDARIGFLGMGNVAQNVVERLRFVNTKEICYFSRNRKPDLEKKWNLKYVSVEALLKLDVCSVHVTYHPETHHYLNLGQYSQCNKNLVLISFSNPKIIEPISLREALVSGKIARAFVDGYYREWVDNKGRQEDPEGLLSLGLDKFVATSHIAAQERSSIHNILEEVNRRMASLLEREHASV